MTQEGLYLNDAILGLKLDKRKVSKRPLTTNQIRRLPKANLVRDDSKEPGAFNMDETYSKRLEDPEDDWKYRESFMLNLEKEGEEVAKLEMAEKFLSDGIPSIYQHICKANGYEIKNMCVNGIMSKRDAKTYEMIREKIGINEVHKRAAVTEHIKTRCNCCTQTATSRITGLTENHCVITSHLGPGLNLYKKFTDKEYEVIYLE
jgi:hypothetical protein